ncbi:Uncharacterised protein [Mycobacteroides abscessus subsp. massiliense]|nr:Uncharacterised protein [Mycobacteroides abscessus subsp. massiliense]SKU76054.1 Uncharacterised protein [Mycobacteroides abscessus subsp. massiliense]
MGIETLPQGGREARGAVVKSPMFSQLLRYPAFYAAVAVAGFGTGVWLRSRRRKVFDPRVGDI